MAVTKLSASAPPYHSTGFVHRTTPPTYVTPVYGQYHYHAATAGSLPFHVVAASRSCVPLFVPAPHPTYSLPSPLGARATVPVLCKAPQVPFGCTAVPLPPSPPPAVPVTIRSNAAPLPPPPAAPVPISCVAAPLLLLLPHGSAPHKIMEAQAAAQLQAAVSTSVKPGQEPAPTAGPHPRGREAQQRTAGVRGRRRQEKLVRARARPARSPSPVFTTRPPSPPVPAPEWFEQPVTTVMIRNIPVKLTPGAMMRLLDDHCARANRNAKRGGGDDGVLSAYDFLYLRMDFRLRCNMGYAFVNLTTAEAARGLYNALHGSRWKVFASKKVIEVCPARIQGKDAQVRHLRGATFVCDTDEFLPAVFSPPRDGAAADPCSPAGLNRVGHRGPHRPLAAAGRRAPPPAALPPRQAWRPIAS